MDRLDTMRSFAAVARLGSFAEAARHLRLSPSVVTRAVAQLEAHLGLTLLSRTTRSVRLTGQGQIYLESCRRILEEIDDAERRARGDDMAPRGELNVAAPLVFGRLHVPPVVNQLLARHRALSVRLMLSDRNVHLVDDNIDVAVRIGALADSSLIAVKLGEVSRVAVASPGYLGERGVPATPAALQAHDLITFEGLDAGHEWRFDGKQAHGPFQARLAVNSADAAIAAAEAGIGIARVLSYQAQAAVQGGRLAVVLQDFAPEAVPVSIIHPARRTESASVTTFIQAARSYFKTHTLLPVQAWSTSK
jgi:DNA-binding transcriptional LysR family regulator